MTYPFIDTIVLIYKKDYRMSEDRRIEKVLLMGFGESTITVLVQRKMNFLKNSLAINNTVIMLKKHFKQLV